jgi:ABC-2 type transport system ATP-binding protein
MEYHKPVITVRNLQHSYDNAIKVLHGIDLEVLPGQVIGYIGPNGAGKTTTVKILTGMLTGFTGDVSVLGFDLKTQAYEVKKRIGYIPENAALYDTLTPTEFLGFIGSLYGIDSENIQSKSWRLMEILGLSDVTHERMNTFSKGMKQKVLIIAGLLHNPDIIFLDEPLSGLDANSALVIKEILAKLATKGKTIFYCSHIMDVVERISHRIVIIDKGKVIADGPFEQLQSMSGQSLEKIFTSLTGNFQHEAIACDFIDAIGM